MSETQEQPRSLEPCPLCVSWQPSEGKQGWRVFGDRNLSAPAYSGHFDYLLQTDGDAEVLCNHLNALQSQVETLKAALEEIADKDSMPWPTYEKKWGVDTAIGLRHRSSSDIARAALASTEASNDRVES